MALGALEGGALLVSLEIGVDKLDQAIDVFDSHLQNATLAKQMRRKGSDSNLPLRFAGQSSTHSD